MSSFSIMITMRVPCGVYAGLGNMKWNETQISYWLSSCHHCSAGKRHVLANSFADEKIKLVNSIPRKKLHLEKLHITK